MNKHDLITVGIADDHPLLRSGIVALMSEYENIEVVFQACNGLEVQQHMKTGIIPSVVLMDINMPEMNGYETALWLSCNFPEVRILVLTMLEEETAIVNMLRNGADGYVLKGSRSEELAAAITTIHQSGVYLNNLVSGRLIHMLRNSRSEIAVEIRITDRELAFIKLCCTELTYKEIADKMFISPKTVDNYREKIFKKLDLKSRSGIILYAVKNQLIEV